MRLKNLGQGLPNKSIKSDGKKPPRLMLAVGALGIHI